MRTLDEAIAQSVPDSFWRFVRETCGAQPGAFRPLNGSEVPEPAKQLLVHRRDMTSTLAEHHGSALRVEILQQRRLGDLYLREVFLRTLATDRSVEYGVIAISLEQFPPAAQDIIQAGRMPLGAVLHAFKLPFISAPIGFFSVDAKSLATTPLAASKAAVCYGRFNRLTKPTGEPLAWIMEILPT